MCAVVIFNYTHPDDHIPPTYEITPGFKAFTFLSYLFFVQQYTKLQSLQGNKDSELEELKSSKQELDALQAKVRILFFIPDQIMRTFWLLLFIQSIPQFMIELNSCG